MKSRAGLLLTLCVGIVPVQLFAQSAPQGIYTCTDAKGRKLTSDRPIPECADREQRVLNPSGTVKTIVGPSLTGPERAALEARQRREAEEPWWTRTPRAWRCRSVSSPTRMPRWRASMRALTKSWPSCNSSGPSSGRFRADRLVRP